jgi:hypothetical protein
MFDVVDPINNMWCIGGVVRDSDGYVAVATTWSFKAFPNFYIGETLGVRLAIQFALDMRFFPCDV